MRDVPKYLLYIREYNGEIERIRIPQGRIPEEGLLEDGQTRVVYWNTPIDNMAEFIESNYYSNTSLTGIESRGARPNPFATWTGSTWTWEPSRIMPLVREERNRLLVETDWAVLPDSIFTEEQLVEIKMYRQKLRDLPGAVDVSTLISVESLYWPPKPDFI